MSWFTMRRTVSDGMAKPKPAMVCAQKCMAYSGMQLGVVCALVGD